MKHNECYAVRRKGEGGKSLAGGGVARRGSPRPSTILYIKGLYSFYSLLWSYKLWAFLYRCLGWRKDKGKVENKSGAAALFGPRSVFPKAALFPLTHREDSGTPVSKSTSWFTREAEQNLGHRLQWLPSTLDWPQKNVFSLWHKKKVFIKHGVYHSVYF